MVDLSDMSMKASFESTAEDLHAAVRAAVRRLAAVTAAFVSAGLLMFLMIEIVRNDSVIRTLQRAPGRWPKLHYILTKGSTDAANLFVVSTAMLAVVAAINIGVAVMPRPVPVRMLDKSNVSARANAMVWNRSLGYSSYLCSLVSIFAAVVGWISGRVPDVWMSATFLTVVAFITTLIAANVAALADDEAERLMGWQAQSRRRRNIDLGLKKVERWPVPWEERSRLWSKAGGWLILSIVGFYAANLLVMCLIALLYVRLPRHEMFASGTGWAVMALWAIVYTIAGLYYVGVLLWIHRAALSSIIRNPVTIPSLSAKRVAAQFISWGRWRPSGHQDTEPPGSSSRRAAAVRWGFRVAVLLVDLILIGLAVGAGKAAHEIPIGVAFATVWVIVPESLCVWAWLRGAGPFGYAMARIVRARVAERDRLKREISDAEKQLLGLSIATGSANGGHVGDGHIVVARQWLRR